VYKSSLSLLQSGQVVLLLTSCNQHCVHQCMGWNCISTASCCWDEMGL